METADAEGGNSIADYEDARKFMAGEQGEIHLELDRIRALLEECGHPERGRRFLHIAGTNGKGSIQQYLANILRASGFTVGTFSSPAVYEYREIIQIDGENISEDDYTIYARQVADGVAALRKKGIACPSPFELETTLALLYFRDRDCDFTFLECGMGGAADATNVIDAPELALFATIGLDHTAFLGDTIEKIAAVKAGIIKEGTLAAVTTGQQDSVTDVLAGVCAGKHVPLITGRPEEAEIMNTSLNGTLFRYGGITLFTPLPGGIQVINAITAFEGARVLQKKYPQITDEKIFKGIATTAWSGRFGRIHEKPDFIVDGAHNPNAARALMKSIDTYYPKSRMIYILGMFRDKDFRDVISLTCGRADLIFTVETPGNDRALPAEELAGAVKDVNSNVICCGSLEEAVDRAFAAAGRNDVILSFGSLSNIGRITELVRQRYS